MSYNKKDWTMPVIVVIGIFVLTIFLNAAVAPMPRYATYYAPAVQNGDVTPMPYFGRQHVYVIDQEATDKISVLSFSLPANGFLVISEEQTGEVLGVSRLLGPGLYGAGEVGLTKSVVPGQKLVATVYTDNGDEKFEAPVVAKEKEASPADQPEPMTSTFIILGR
jgi:hypothetical protein